MVEFSDATPISTVIELQRPSLSEQVTASVQGPNSRPWFVPGARDPSGLPSVRSTCGFQSDQDCRSVLTCPMGWTASLGVE